MHTYFLSTKHSLQNEGEGRRERGRERGEREEERGRREGEVGRGKREGRERDMQSPLVWMQTNGSPFMTSLLYPYSRSLVGQQGMDGSSAGPGEEPSHKDWG